jgi:tetratricopeptide (TPR) repeat protein
MSLLMDALKRAETAKQEAARNQQGGLLPTASDIYNLDLNPLELSKGANGPLPDLATHFAAVNADLAMAALSEPPRPSTPNRAAPEAQLPEPRETVRNAFAAKQAEVQQPARGPLWLALGALAIAGIAICGYVWYQMNTMSNGSLAASTKPAMIQPAPMPRPQPAPAAPPPDQALAERLPAPTSPGATGTSLFPRQDARPVQRPAPESSTPEAAQIRLTRTRPEPDINLANGHASLQRGDTEQSRQAFQQALQRDPNNTDALLALAAIAQRQGRPADAEGLRQRALVANPSDLATQAAILGGPSAKADPLTAESRLKSLLSSQPESAPLNFALGNLYASQGRWAEAQQVYFNAVAAEGDNPDYLFNLAVSLDHLRQPRLAAQHYRLALEASSKRPAGFERSNVQKRLDELQAERLP